MDKKELTKMVAKAMNVGAFYGAGLGALAVGGITLMIGGGFFALFTRNAKRFSRNYPGWAAGWDELKEDQKDDGDQM